MDDCPEQIEAFYRQIRLLGLMFGIEAAESCGIDRVTVCATKKQSMFFLRAEVREKLDAEEWVLSPSEPPAGSILSVLVGRIVPDGIEVA